MVAGGSDGPTAPAGGRGASAVAALLVLALVVGVAFGDVLFGGRTLSVASYVPGVLPSGPVGAPAPPLPAPVRDLEGAAWVDEPSPYLVHAAIAAGRLPLWSAASGLGAPLLGNPNSGTLSPLQWLVNLAPSPIAQDLAWIGRVYLLGAATWLLATALGCGAIGSVVAAVASMLAGQTLDWIDHHPLNTDAFVPLALFAALRLPRAGRRGLALLAMSIAAGLLGLKPQSALVAGAFGLIWLLAEARDRRRSRAPGEIGLPARILAWCAGLALGGALAAVALVPFAETFSQANDLVRAGRTTQSEWTVPLEAWRSLVAPWLGAEGSSTGGGAPAVVPAGLPYAGAGVLVLAAWGFWSARRRRLAWALAATVLFYVLKAHGLFPLTLARVPLLASVSFVKYCFPLYLALALLAGLGAAGIARRSRIAGAALALVAVGELLVLARRERPERVPLYAPAPYVEALRALVADAPGRIAGPVDLAPPLVSGALGFRDLRAIDVLTPRATWEVVSRLVAPSQGVTWILADPDPLLAATSPAAPLTDLRYVLARGPLAVDDLDRATRSLMSARRLVALFGTLEGYSIETAKLTAGIHELGGDRRFHWTCVTPCRLRFDLASLPARFAVGVGTATVGRVDVGVVARARTGEERALAAVVDTTTEPASWRDLWVDRPSSADSAATPAGTIEIRLESQTPQEVFVGGIGPSPGESAERDAVARELAYRREAAGKLSLRWSDSTAHIYETGRVLGPAYVATPVVRVDDADELDACVLAHANERAGCVAGDGHWPTASSGDAVVAVDAEASSVALTDSPTGGLLVFSRLFYPGWRARIDGAEASLERVNGALMGVVVPPGAHWVEVDYRPWSVAVGAAISLVALAIVAGLVVQRRERAGSRFEGAESRR